MLVLQRRRDEKVIITAPDGTRIEITACNFRGYAAERSVRLGIVAPPEYAIHRAEVQAAIDAERQQA